MELQWFGFVTAGSQLANFMNIIRFVKRAK